MRRTRYGLALLAFAALLVHGATASAGPVLQLDIAGGHYDNDTKTIVARDNPFSLFAILTPPAGSTAEQISAGLGATYYLSMAVTPMVGPPGASLGSMTVNGQTVDVTADMTYGKPPIESIPELQGADRGDLQGHDIYPTYFAEFAFQFSPTRQTGIYDTALAAQAPGGSAGPVPSANGGAYYTEFIIDTSALNPNYTIHFDLYNATARRCGLQEQQMTGLDPSCVDVDVNAYAPFTHDAQSPPVPEPATIVLFGTGMAAAAARRRFRRQRSA